MRLLDTINRALCVICAAMAAFCLGYALVTGTLHVLFLAALNGVTAYLIAWRIRSDQRFDEEMRNRNGGGAIIMLDRVNRQIVQLVRASRSIHIIVNLGTEDEITIVGLNKDGYYKRFAHEIALAVQERLNQGSK